MSDEPRFTQFPSGNVEFNSGNNFEFWCTVDHAIRRCDATTGHAANDVAFCDTPERARILVHAVASRADLLAACKEVLRCAVLPNDWADPIRCAIIRAESLKP